MTTHILLDDPRDTLPPSVSAREIADTVERYVRLRTGGTIRALHVEVSAGEIVLSGRTSTYYNKQLATHAALDVTSDCALTNDIEVC